MKTTKKQLEDLWQKYSLDTCNEKEFDDWCDVLNDESLNEASEQFLKKRWVTWQIDTSRNLIRKRWYYSAAAAAAVFLMIIFTPFLIRQNQTPTMTEVAFSGSHITLQDGSTVILRDGSRLKPKTDFLNGDTREIYLEGEARFEIAHNPERPFIVHTGKARTTVLGTIFTVRAVPGETLITVTVAKGKVVVEDGVKLLATLEANQQLIYDVGDEYLQEMMHGVAIEMDDLNPHDLIFRNMLFADIAQQLAIQYGINIVFEDECLGRQRINALLDRRNSLETLLNSLCASQHASYTVEGRTYVIRQSNEK